jgi:hypothetical protein
LDVVGASLLKGFLLSLSKNPVMVDIKEGLLLVGVVRVPFWMKPGVLVGSDGSFETREISDEEDCTTCCFNVCPLWVVSFKDVSLLIRGGSRGVRRPAAVLRGGIDGRIWVVMNGILRDNRH